MGLVSLPKGTEKIAIGAAIVLAVYVFANRKQGQSLVQSTAESLASGTVGVFGDALGGIVTGTVVGIGQQVGIPATNVDECTKCKRAGDAWGASFACPAGDYLKWLWAGKPTNV